MTIKELAPSAKPAPPSPSSTRSKGMKMAENLDWIAIAQRGFEAWKAKPHNARWFRKIDGTPIPNDLTICIGQAFADELARRSPSPAVEGGWRDVLAERERQKTVEGWTDKRDDNYTAGQLAKAAACYALSAGCWMVNIDNLLSIIWPWHSKWWKPTTPRRDLVKAGALILAEIERLDRAALPTPPAGEKMG